MAFPTEDMALTRLLVVANTDRARTWYRDAAYEVSLFGPQNGIISVPLLFPFATYRFLIIADENEQAALSFQQSGTITTSARRSTEGVPAGDGFVTESLVVPGFKPWSPLLPPELPEEECESAARMVVATTAASPTQGSGGELSGASFALDVTDIDTISCCLHGQWLMNNEDLAAADTEGLGLTVTYSGQLTADYRPDGTVLFLWGGITSTIQGMNGASTAVINGGGTQFYEVPSPGFLIYGPPEIIVSVDETSASGQTASFSAPLETGLGDFPSQPFECTDDTLVTIIRGDDAIGRTRMTSE